jgi:N-acetylglucosamine repressor
MRGTAGPRREDARTGEHMVNKSNIGNSALITRVNRGLVLQAVRTLQPTYRAEVSRRTNLNPATVTGIVSDLLGIGLLQEVPGQQLQPLSTLGGRPPLMLQINADARKILAIDLEPDWIRVALVDLNMKILDYSEQAIDRLGEPGRVVDRICQLSRQVLKRAQPDGIDGAALSLPGLIDRERGILHSSTNMPKWRDVPVASAIAKVIHVTPLVERSVHLAAIHEDWVATDEPNSTKLILSLRTGIGMSIVRNGELYVGSRGFDGEIGHTIVDIGGELCECGCRGCLETFVSATAVCRRVRAMSKEGRCKAIKAATDRGEHLHPGLVYRLAKEGDPDCIEIVNKIGCFLGIAAANMVNLLAPDSLILCGSIDTADELILSAIRKQIDQCALPKMREHLSIRLSAAKERSSLLGAAALVAKDLFALPRLRYPGINAHEAVIKE